MAALAAAVVPALGARSAAGPRSPLGATAAEGSSRRGLTIGVVLVAVAVAMTSLGAVLRAALSGHLDSTLLLLGGAVLGTLGFGAWPVAARATRAASARLPVASRIALRDTGPRPLAHGPIVTALLAAFAATVALSPTRPASTPATVANWRPYLHADQ